MPNLPLPSSSAAFRFPLVEEYQPASAQIFQDASSHVLQIEVQDENGKFKTLYIVRENDERYRFKKEASYSEFECLVMKCLIEFDESWPRIKEWPYWKTTGIIKPWAESF